MLFSVVLSLAALAVAAPAEIKARANTVCGKTTYYDSDVSDAANAACQYVQSGGTAGSSTYPHKYNDYEGFGFNGVQAPYYEFPILSSFKVYTGGMCNPVAWKLCASLIP